LEVNLIINNNNINNNNRIYVLPYGHNFRGAGWSQINDTIEPSLTAQDINPIAYVR